MRKLLAAAAATAMLTGCAGTDGAGSISPSPTSSSPEALAAVPTFSSPAPELIPGTPAPRPKPTIRKTKRPVVRKTAPRPDYPVGASAVCRDGSISFSQHRRGTCSHHGGVARWL